MRIDLLKLTGPQGRSRIRPLARWGFLTATALALWPLLPGSSVPALVPGLSPFVTAGTILATRSFPFVAWLGLLVGLAVLVRRRLFCRWMCPVGLCLDGAGSLGRKLGRRTPRFPQLGPWIVLAALGGAWFPLEVTPPLYRQVVQVLPSTWAMRAYTALLARQASVVEVLPYVGVLCGFAVLFMAAAALRFSRYQEN